jgi:hypothetical protein
MMVSCEIPVQDDPNAIARKLVHQLIDFAVATAARRLDPAASNQPIGSTRPSPPRAPAIPASWVWYRFVRLHAAIEDASSGATSSAFSSVGRLLTITGIHIRTAGQVRNRARHPRRRLAAFSDSSCRGAS